MYKHVLKTNFKVLMWFIKIGDQRQTKLQLVQDMSNNVFNEIEMQSIFVCFIYILHGSLNM